MIAQGAQQSTLRLDLAAYVRPRENQNADTLRLGGLGEGMLADLRRLVRADPTFGGRAKTHIAESKLLGGSQNDGSFDDVGAFVVQPIQLTVFWTDPDWIDVAIEAVKKACKGIKKSAGYHNTVRYVSRRATDPEDVPTADLPAVWVLRPLGPSEDLAFIDE